MEIIYILTAIGLVLVIMGAAYAVLIYYAPAPYGWTWVSVVVGDAFTDLGMMFAVFVILVYVNQLQLWPMVFIPPIAHILTGGPMIAGQIIKKRHDEQESKKIGRGHGKTATKMAE